MNSRVDIRSDSPEGPCERCGILTQTRIGNIWICEDCYVIRSSCCPEFGPDDLAEENLPRESDKPRSTTERRRG